MAIQDEVANRMVQAVMAGIRPFTLAEPASVKATIIYQPDGSPRKTMIVYNLGPGTIDICKGNTDAGTPGNVVGQLPPLTGAPFSEERLWVNLRGGQAQANGFALIID